MVKKHMPRLNRRNYLKATGAGLAVSAFAGCLGDDDDDDDDGVTDDTDDGDDTVDDDDELDWDNPITIAAIIPLSGPFAVYGPPYQEGAEFAADEINENGGVLGRPIEIDVYDSESSGAEANSGFTAAIDGGAVAGIGPVNSDAALQTGQLANTHEVPLFLHAAGGSAITPQDNRYIFRTNLPATPTCGRVGAHLVEDLGFDKVGMIVEDGLWGDEYAGSFHATISDDVEIQEDNAPIPETDFVPLLRNFDDDIECFLGTSHPAGISSLYSQVYEVGMDPELFLGAITPVVAEWDSHGDILERSFASFNAVDFYSEAYQEAASAYTEETGNVLDTAQISAHTAINVVVSAIDETGETDGAELGDAIRTGTFDDVLFGGPLEYTEYGEPDNAIQIYNGFTADEPLDSWPEDTEFGVHEVFRSDPLPAYAHDLDL